jgi:hypothetical protein
MGDDNSLIIIIIAIAAAVFFAIYEGYISETGDGTWGFSYDKKTVVTFYKDDDWSGEKKKLRTGVYKNLKTLLTNHKSFEVESGSCIRFYYPGIDVLMIPGKYESSKLDEYFSTGKEKIRFPKVFSIEALDDDTCYFRFTNPENTEEKDDDNMFQMTFSQVKESIGNWVNPDRVYDVKDGCQIKLVSIDGKALDPSISVNDTKAFSEQPIVFELPGETEMTMDEARSLQGTFKLEQG